MVEFESRGPWVISIFVRHLGVRIQISWRFEGILADLK
jgi:hypothetical protein